MNDLSIYLNEYSNAYNHSLDVIESVSKLTLKKDLKHIIIPNWTDILKRYGGGDCVDIAENLYFKLSSNLELKDNLYFAEGTEPRYFSSKIQNHAFLYIENSNRDDAFILDPSLQIYAKYSESGYFIRSKRTLHSKIIREKDRQFKVYDGEGYPNINIQTGVLGLTEDNKYAMAIGFMRDDNTVVPVAKIYNSKDIIMVSSRKQIISNKEDLGVQKNVMEILNKFNIS